ncbi:ribonuclease HII [Rhodovulum sulfidophilum]|uniref:Ribonuclease HII n=1 Tax=Rhodovulum sulfidophilum TaxID=35806 RepID=A0ABS1RQA9_RHOSU|nr:ribonuclease HII [Rhodovulum sulfidophilum]MBK5922229.1 ribonuclease HII [Rhodovulum sulfidophilum]MBL3608254.1 ribonuclease HII [Rhodovulum sulfidophilum]MCE8457360.1 ribonuclease HII [Rhodovulum sulfidophilum]
MTVVRPDFSLETEAFARGVRLVAGVDEVGRGPLAGPVMAAAVCLVAEDIPDGLRDSKTLSARRREGLAAEIHARALVGLGEASTGEIEEMNILQASHLAMCRALAALPAMPDLALIDGNRMPRALPCDGLCLVKGDARCLSIAAASIVAKVARDAVMTELAQHWPGYGWERNAGYPTRQHLQALRDLGVSPHHRRSFRPVHNILWQEKSVNP